jgi:hypothetical protein
MYRVIHNLVSYLKELMCRVILHQKCHKRKSDSQELWTFHLNEVLTAEFSVNVQNDYPQPEYVL